MFDTSVSAQDSFTELTSGLTMTSLPVPAKSAVVESTPRMRSSRALSFDDDTAQPERRRGGCSAARPSLTARRRSRSRCNQPSISSDRLPSTCTAVNEHLTPTEPCLSHVTMSSIISGCIEEDEERADLIGDMTDKHALPLERNSKHADLKTISPHTVSSYVI